MKTIFALIFINSILYSQIDSTLKNFFPMQIGNIWEYSDFYGNRSYVKVTGDTIMPNGYKYAVFRYTTQNSESVNSTFGFYRIDDTMNIRIYSGGSLTNCNTDWIIFKLNAKDSTFWKECGQPYDYPCLVNTREQYFSAFNLTKTTKKFGGAVIDQVTGDTSFGGSFYFLLNELSKDIGITRTAGEMIPEFKITGAIVNGVKYGQITDIQEDYLTPSEFNLYQNYPNPFNPSTSISYSLPENSKVVMEVYNMLGEKVAGLVNEIKSAGFHETVFSGNNLSSGIYIYRITAYSLESGKQFVRSHKMLLVK